jgi:hypothetical protein
MDFGFERARTAPLPGPPDAVIALAAIELSFGPTGRLYPWLLDNVTALNGLRAPARFGIVALCAIAVLAGLGMRVIQERVARQHGGAAAALVALVLVLLSAEYGNTGMTLARVAPDPPDSRNVYVMLRSLEPGVVLELPRPNPHALPGYDPWYAFWSRSHWNPLVNGYSGYYPPEYGRSLANTERFPDSHSIAYLTALKVRYVIVHRSHFEDDDDFVELVLRMSKWPELERFGRLEAPHGEVELFRLVRHH